MAAGTSMTKSDHSKKPSVSPAAKSVRSRTQPTDPSVIRWVNLPLQERSRLKLDQIVTAFEKLIAEKGLDGATVADIAREAGCSVGAFYTRFNDKGDLFRYVILHRLEEGLQSFRAMLTSDQWRAVPSDVLIRTLVDFVVELHRRREGLLHAFYEQAHKDPVVMSHLSQAGVEVEEILLALIIERRAEITHPDPRIAAAFAVRLVLATMQLRSLWSPHTPQETHFAWNTWSEEVSASLLAYFGIARK